MRISDWSSDVCSSDLAARDAAVGHGDGHLVQRLRQQRPEIPVVVGGTQAGAWIALDGMVQVRKAQRITEEEDWRAVADDVPVAFLGVELQGEAADVTLGISRPALAGDGRKARSEEHTSELPSLKRIPYAVFRL